MKLRSAIAAIAFSAVAWSACKKDDATGFDRAAVYHKTSTEPAGDVRVFAQSGELNTPAIVSRFTAADSTLIHDVSGILFSMSSDSIQMQDNENAKIRESSGYADYKVTSSGGDLIFTGKDTSTNTSIGEVYSKSIPYYISLYKPAIYSEYIISSTRGNYVFGYTTKNQLVLTQQSNRLVAPWIFLIDHSSGSRTFAFTVQNKADFSFYRSLAATDTVVLHEYSVIYGK